MEIRYNKINPTNNITLLVETAVEREKQAQCAAKLMALDTDVEQVGFLEKAEEGSGCLFHLQMAGGEFCGNASLSAAAIYANGFEELIPGHEINARFSVSGSDKPVEVKIKKLKKNSFSGRLAMSLPTAIDKLSFTSGGVDYELPVAYFPGIVHVVMEDKITESRAEEIIKDIRAATGAQAVGLMLLDKESKQLRPLVYVPAVDSLIWEQSCASGTAAVVACMAVKADHSLSMTLMQPGGVLSVDAHIDREKLIKLVLHGSAVLCGSESADIELD